MIKIGIDSVDIERFQAWATFSHKKLLRVYTQDELDYCFSEPRKTQERLAVRFAAKEAFYKALSPMLVRPKPFLSIAQKCSVSYTSRGEPLINFSWDELDMPRHHIELSLTHTHIVACAMVLIISAVSPLSPHTPPHSSENNKI